jgi:hypothetical protein
MTRHRHVLSFLGSQWPWALLAPLLMLLGTALHESAHALGVLVSGGRVLGLDLLPVFEAGHFRFGQTRWAGLEHPPDLALAFPFLLAHGHATLGALASARFAGRAGRVLFFTSSLLPMFDVAQLHAGLWLGSRTADLGKLSAEAAFGARLSLPLLLGLAALSWRAFRRNWPAPAGLDGPSFAVLLTLLLAAPMLRYALGFTR